jgi:hypothetical protein
MGSILDDITNFKNSLTGGSFEALAAATGESNSIRWLGANTTCSLISAWGADSATKCQFSVRSPLLHDNVRGMRFGHMFNPTLSANSGKPQIYLSPYWTQPYDPTDTLIVEANGTAADRAIFTQFLRYESPTISGARLIHASEVEARLNNLVGILVTPTGGATGDYGATVALNSSDDRLKANTDYALIGYTSDLMFTTCGIFGPDTANFTIPFPGSWQEDIDAGWFYELSRQFNIPFVPVFNANNKGVTFVKVADVGGAVSPNIILQFAELKP